MYAFSYVLLIMHLVVQIHLTMPKLISSIETDICKVLVVLVAELKIIV